jgi:hypothetical protein
VSKERWRHGRGYDGTAICGEMNVSSLDFAARFARVTCGGCLDKLRSVGLMPPWQDRVHGTLAETLDKKIRAANEKAAAIDKMVADTRSP